MTKARSNAVANAAKGDLTVGTGTNLSGILAVGASGETLVADSSTTTGLRYTENYAAGKNKIINGDFNINQRGFTSTTTSVTYGFDRFFLSYGDGTVTYSAQTFTPGAAPVAGYEAANFARVETTGQTLTNSNAIFRQRIENVRTVTPNENWTVSFYAKAASSAPKVYVELEQNFGTGGSPSAAVIITGSQVTLSTSFARYSVTIAVPSISGKTIGTTTPGHMNVNLWVSAGTDFNARTGSLGIQTNTFDFWGVQVEAGLVATAFQTATGTLAGELAACQRYFEQYDAAGSHVFYSGYQQTSITPRISLSVVPKRTTPTISFTGTLQVLVGGGSGFNVTSIDAIAYAANSNMLGFRANIASGGTAGDACALFASGAVSILYSAEL